MDIHLIFSQKSAITLWNNMCNFLILFWFAIFAVHSKPSSQPWTIICVRTCCAIKYWQHKKNLIGFFFCCFCVLLHSNRLIIKFCNWLLVTNEKNYLQQLHELAVFMMDKFNGFFYTYWMSACGFFYGNFNDYKLYFL